MNVSESKYREIRDLAEADLSTFARLINPGYVYGEIHEEVFHWLQAENAEYNQLLLLPRGHLKSHCMAVWTAWWVTRHPETTILYISATSTLAEEQLYAVKNMLDNEIHRRYWPDLLARDEGKRERWSATAISVDSPIRRSEAVRDPTVRTAGLTTNTTGLHADVIVADDVVVPDNAYTEEGRRKVSAAMSQMSSIKNAGGFIKACGTRYHPSDIYDVWAKLMELVYDEESDEVVGDKPVWEILERVVETDGKFLWPRRARPDGKSFGFDRKILSRIQAEYTDKTQYYAQYYNNPNDPGSNIIGRDKFQYYDKKFIQRTGGVWNFKGRPLNLYASADFAYSVSKRSDYTAIVVIGIDAEGYIFILDIDRFKAEKISVLFDHVLDMHNKWEFRKLRAEVNAAQGMIVRDLKDKIRMEGMNLSIDEHKPTRHGGSKEERMAAILEPRYDNQTMYHFQGGYIPELEEELVLARPPHDDMKDALASAIEIARAPQARREKSRDNVIQFNNRFGGIAFR